MQIRRELTDEKRLLRIYGSNVVLARLTGEGAEARAASAQLRRPRVKGLRVRVLGSYAQGKAGGFRSCGRSELQDYGVQDGRHGVHRSRDGNVRGHRPDEVTYEERLAVRAVVSLRLTWARPARGQILGRLLFLLHRLRRYVHHFDCSRTFGKTGACTLC